MQDHTAKQQGALNVVISILFHICKDLAENIITLQ